MGYATGIGALINLLLNFLTVPKYGALGAAAATAVSYFVMYFMAFRIVRKYVKIETKPVRNYISYILLVIQSVVMINSIGPFYVINGLIFLLLFLLYAKEAAHVFGKMKGMIYDRKTNASQQ